MIIVASVNSVAAVTMVLLFFFFLLRCIISHRQARIQCINALAFFTNRASSPFSASLVITIMTLRYLCITLVYSSSSSSSIYDSTEEAIKRMIEASKG
jgi:hypothetical protein